MRSSRVATLGATSDTSATLRRERLRTAGTRAAEHLPSGLTAGSPWATGEVVGGLSYGRKYKDVPRLPSGSPTQIKHPSHGRPGDGPARRLHAP